MKNYLIVALLMATSCTYPQTTVSTVAANPTLRITGASETAVVLIDGQPAGAAKAYGEGGHALVIPHGTHRVEVRDEAALLYGSDVYFGDDTTKTISLTGGIQ